jgi:lysophospholipase L1-like esterase
MLSDTLEERVMWKRWVSVLVLACGVTTACAQVKPHPAAPADSPAAPATAASQPATRRAEPTDQPVRRSNSPRIDWTARHDAYVKLAEKGGVDVYFLGDSITDGWHKEGKAIWDREFAPLKAENFGIAGDRTQHVLYRVTNGEFPDALKPKVVVLMIGTNNTNAHDTPEQVAAGNKAIVETIRRKSPETKILLLAIFPRGETPADPLRKNNEAANAMIAKLADGKAVRFLNINEKFLDKDGVLSKEIMPDLLHPNAKGYEIWAEAIREPLKEMLR